ncbi:alpha/beta hydrolase [Candidatus Uabimicrobium sp. HlEnr_7]|uniref:alpha/beta hydrolase n=1 Tax=Candidatus Uabimicrobium helgolandensis TaxID=3095367 RepID=UPI003558A4C0
MKFIFTVVVFLFSVTAFTQQTNDLTILNCNNGNDSFLSSPQEIPLQQLQQNFDASVDTVVLVHGFNNTFSSAKRTFNSVYPVLKSKLGHVNYVGFHWPVNISIDFGKGMKHANKAGDYLTHVLATMTNWYGGSNNKIHIISHSLGARVVLSSLNNNSARYINWGYCNFFAPAVHNNVFLTSFKGTNIFAPHNFVYYSKNDYTLKYTYALWYWLFGRNDNWQNIPGSQDFIAMSMDEKLQYMHSLETKNSRSKNEFEQQLFTQILRAEKDAMGLVGASTEDVVTKVSNTNAADFVSGHSYWQSETVLHMAAERIISGEFKVARSVVNKKVVHGSAAGKTIWKVPGKNGFFWGSGMSVDADGAPKAYHRQKGKGLDYLANAGHPGNWWGIVTKNGVPVIQKSTDPAPGYYVSQTAMFSSQKSIYDPRRYVNASTIPFYVLPARKSMGAKIGDIAAVINTRSNKVAYAMYADVGPRNHIGEGSIALAEDLGINSSPKKGGISSGIVFVVFPGSGNGNGRLRTRDEIREAGQRLFSQWGGMKQLEAVWSK